MSAQNQPTWMARRDVTWHGTRNGYEYHSCRCEACRTAYALYHRTHRLRPQSQQGETHGAAERDWKSAERAPERHLSKRLIQDGERRYTAYSLDELIEIDSLASHGRPGHLFG